MKDFHSPLHSRSVFSSIGVVPALQMFLRGSGGPAGEWRGGQRGTSEAYFWRRAVFWRAGWHVWGLSLSGLEGVPKNI